VSHKVILTNPFSRERFKRIVDKAPSGYVAEVREPKRTLEQNDLMWSLLTQVSIACPGGHRYTPDEWKSRFMHACGWECQFLPGISDGHPFPVGFRSSKLSKKQMSNLIDFILAWGAEQGLNLDLEKAA
jgi:hypothetical protein